MGQYPLQKLNWETDANLLPLHYLTQYKR